MAYQPLGSAPAVIDGADFSSIRPAGLDNWRMQQGAAIWEFGARSARGADVAPEFPETDEASAALAVWGWQQMHLVPFTKGVVVDPGQKTAVFRDGAADAE